MRAKRDKIEKDQKRFISSADKRDQDMTKAEKIAKVGEEVDPSIQGSKIRFSEIFCRLRSNKKEMLDKRSEFLRTKFEAKRIILTNEIGAQLTMANNLFPYRISSKYINTTDLKFFARYNFLGGLYMEMRKKE